MSAPVDDVAFLARSENRMAVLEVLADGPADRSDLRESTSVGRVTLGRVLGDFGERGWIVGRSDAYELTSVGELVAEAFDDVVEAMATADKLRAVASWLPADDVDFDLRWLSTAELYVPTPNDPFASLRRAQEGLESTESLQLLTNATAEETLEVITRRTSADELSMSAVVEAETLTVIADNQTTRSQLQTLLAVSGEVFRHDGPVPFIVAVLDDVVHLGVDDNAGVNVALIESDDPRVRSWAMDTIETYRREATRLHREDIGT